MTPKEFLKVFSLLEKEHQPTLLEQLAEYSVFQRLIVALLSSRTKDTITLPIVNKLFERYKTPSDFVKEHTSRLEKALYGIGFYKVKANNLKKLSKIILEEYSGKVPHTLEELTSLPGVGRKTANCVLSYALNKPAIAVDVHVHRISNRLGWVKTKKPEETEIELQKLLPKESWGKVNRLFVDHGQRVCLAIKPKCSLCKLKSYCAYGANDYFSYLPSSNSSTNLTRATISHTPLRIKNGQPLNPRA